MSRRKIRKGSPQRNVPNEGGVGFSAIFDQWFFSVFFITYFICRSKRRLLRITVLAGTIKAAALLRCGGRHTSCHAGCHSPREEQSDGTATRATLKTDQSVTYSLSRRYRTVHRVQFPPRGQLTVHTSASQLSPRVCGSTAKCRTWNWLARHENAT